MLFNYALLHCFFVYYVFQQKKWASFNFCYKNRFENLGKTLILFLAVWQHNKRLLGLFNTNVKILGTNIFQFNFKILNTNTYFSKGVTFPLTFVAYPEKLCILPVQLYVICKRIILHGSIYCFTIRYRFEFSLAPVYF